MAQCEKRVEGQMMAYPCTLEAGHERNGPADDPEPCMTAEVARSVRLHDNWEMREAARFSHEETVESVVEEIEQTLAGEQVAEPEHNLRSPDCMMRPADSAPGLSGETCPMCTPRPQVLVDNDAAIRAGLIHNPFDSGCTKRSGGDQVLPGEHCYICRPEMVREALVEPPEPESEVAEQVSSHNLKDALGHDRSVEEIGLAMTRIPVDDTGAVYLNHFFWGVEGDEACGHPFCGEPPEHHKPEEDVEIPVLLKSAEPTKQREGDQVLPKAGDRAVQDWMIERESERIEVAISSGLPDLDQITDGEQVIKAMEESKRVGTERYGQPLHTFDGRINIRDLAEELRDAFVYVSKMQMTAEADRETLVRMVAEAFDPFVIDEGLDGSPRGLAEVAVARILDWVLIQKIGPEQVRPIVAPS